MRKQIYLPFKQVWEDEIPSIFPDVELFSDTYTCPHVIEEGGQRRVKRVIQAVNEGGYRSTGVCLDCLIDWFVATGEIVAIREHNERRD